MLSRTGRIAVGLAAALTMSACAVNVYEEGSGTGGGEGAVASEENTGSVSISGAETGDEGAAIQAVIDEGVNSADGVEYTATYTGSDSFEQNVVIQIEGGTPPDVGVFPQPGAVLEQAQRGNAVALEDLGFDIADLEDRFGEYLMSLGEYEGKHYGLPNVINFKSAVWYNKPAFEEAGYEIPETWDEMIELSDQIVEDGKAPWCIGTGSEAATGWPATDWMEDIVLRSQGTDVYDQWVEHEIDFDSPEITDAAERFGEIIFADGYVFGGHENMTSTDFRDAPDPLFQDDPPCYLHRQATFIPAFFPDGLTALEDYDFFPFPTIDGNSGSLMAGTMAAVFSNRPEVADFIDRYTSQETGCLYGKQEGTTVISANIDVGPDCYTNNELVAQAVEPLIESLQAGEARFDASDLMPPAVGSGAFWTGMNDYTNNGPDNLQSVLSSIDSAWPSDSGGDSSESGSEG